MASVRTRMAVLFAAAVVAMTALVGCGSDQPADGKVTLRLGYFPNLTHASALVGVEKGFFAQKLGDKVALETKTFNAGPEAVQALFSGAVDAIYIGPNPTVNAWSQSKGAAVKVVAGSASGGVFFVVKPSISSPADLRGKTIATPQLGNTQDVALRYWLKQQGLTSTKEGGGDVHIKPQDNATTVDTFSQGQIDGAWVPEPYASRLVAKGGKILVDERDLWPGKQFVITNLVVSTPFLTAHRDVVKNLIAGQVAANTFINDNPHEAQQVINAAIARVSGKPLDTAQLATALKSITFLNDPLTASLRDGAKHAEDVGLLKPVDLTGLYDLTLLNEVLAASGEAKVEP